MDMGAWVFPSHDHGDRTEDGLKQTNECALMFEM